MGRRQLAVGAAVFVVVLALLCIRLGKPQLHTDELTYMSTVLESLVQGRALPVQGSGAVFVNKPPLALWLMRGSFALLGASPFAARLPSALLAAATAVVLYLFGSAILGEAAGVVAALLFALAPGPLLEHGIRSATPDSLEILLVTLAIAALELWRRHRRRAALAGLVAIAAALAWVKSPFALAVVLAYALASEPLARRAGRATPRFAATIGLVTAAWTASYLLWLAVLSADSSAYSVAKRLLLLQYVRRVEGRLGAVAGPGYYLTAIGGDFGALLVLPLAAGALAWAAARPRPYRPRYEVLCLAVWALVAPLLATLSASKLPWYTYLSYPGIALLLGVAAQRLARGVSTRRMVRAAVLAAVVALAAWRLPASIVWPAHAQYRNPTGRLWEIARGSPWLTVVPAAGLELPHSLDTDRETRFFVRLLLWEKRGSRAAAGGTCAAVLVNAPRDASASALGADGKPLPAVAGVVQLHRPRRRGGVPLYLVDRCDGRLRDRLAAR